MTPTNKLLALPSDLQLKMLEFLSIRDVGRVQATCKRLQATASWEKRAQISIAQVSQYQQKSCSWCYQAIVVIRECNYEASGLRPRQILRLMALLERDTSHPRFSSVLDALKCTKKVGPRTDGPCVWI